MPSTIQFVDSIASSPSVLLDLNDTTSANAFQIKELDLSPPPLRRVVSGTPLVDGDLTSAAAWEDRVVKLSVQMLRATSTDTGATMVQNLARELNKERNILKVQLEGATSPVFFKTKRAPDVVLSMLRLLFKENTVVTLALPADPTAWGLQETPVVLQTLNTNPAGGAAGDCFFDVTSVKGDVETPAYIRYPGTGATSTAALFAVKRRGTPSAAPFLFQAEAMTQGTNTTTQANDALFSGSSNNWSRCTFGTATMQTRISTLDLGTASKDLRGRYRVFLRYRKTVSTDDINIVLRWGDTSGFLSVDNDAFEPPNTTSICMADLGEISIPTGNAPRYGPDGVELSVSDAFSMAVRAERTAGSGNLDFDFLLLVPSDDRLAIAEFVDSTGVSYWSLYAQENSVYGRDASDRIISAPLVPLVGGLPMLTPNQTNRVYMLRTVASGSSYTLTTITNISISYWPRYLTIRPAST